MDNETTTRTETAPACLLCGTTLPIAATGASQRTVCDSCLKKMKAPIGRSRSNGRRR